VRREISESLTSCEPLRGSIEDLLFRALQYDRAGCGEGEELTALAIAANTFADAFYLAHATRSNA
jgi:hypothetical protein